MKKKSLLIRNESLCFIGGDKVMIKVANFGTVLITSVMMPTIDRLCRTLSRGDAKCCGLNNIKAGYSKNIDLSQYQDSVRILWGRPHTALGKSKDSLRSVLGRYKDNLKSLESRPLQHSLRTAPRLSQDSLKTVPG